MTYSDVTTRQQRDALARQYDRFAAAHLALGMVAEVNGDDCGRDDQRQCMQRARWVAATLRSEWSQSACIDAHGQYRAAVRLFDRTAA